MKYVNNIALIFVCFCSVPLWADDTDFANRWYAGVGMGISRLEPDSNNTIYNVSDDKSNGWKLYAGYDWSERLGLEAYITDLGEASLIPNGTVEYQDFGFNALYYLYNSEGDQGRFQRTDFSIFLKAGIGFMKNTSDVNYRRIHDEHLLLGVGLEYGDPDGISLRAEAELFDEDSHLFSISIMKRFGKGSKR